ncbi:NepR family anti-sigma factor [Roseovarius sp. E0-M6]|uniref:NepR family anti-sigma factor n=1 Tax=Roseovarius sp. E0-M6 TaxID=3127118 RepID=UPI0030104DFE
MTQKRRQTVLDRQIDENLRRVYSEMTQEPVPDRLTALLQQLRDKEAETDAAIDPGDSSEGSK